MRILVTRPRHQSEQLIRALENRGHSVDLLPLLNIEPVIFDAAERQNIIDRLARSSKLISVSANASDLAVPLLSELFRANSESNYELFAIGPSTASVLEKEGYKVQMPEGEYNSEALLELSAFNQINGQKISLLCGQGGRDYLQQKLSAKGAQVERIELYRRTPITDTRIDAKVLSRPEVLTAMSGDTVEALDSVLLDSNLPDWKKMPLIVPGKRVADIAFERGFTEVLCSQKPTTESLLDVLVELE